MDDFDMTAGRDLREPLGRLKAAANQRTPDRIRRRLLAEFDTVHARRRFEPRWALIGAAAVLIAVALTLSSRLGPASAVGSIPARSGQSEWEQLAGSADGEFVAVPYASPLAPGESVDVIRTQLDTQALDRMGLNVVMASAASARVDADLVLGQDGLPRAVRVLQPSQF